LKVSTGFGYNQFLTKLDIMENDGKKGKLIAKSEFEVSEDIEYYILKVLGKINLSKLKVNKELYGKTYYTGLIKL